MVYQPHLDAAPGAAEADSIYVRLYKVIRADIETGKLSAGERMPSIRALARQLDLSVTPIETAYLQLAVEGYLHGQARRGYFVADMPEAGGGAEEKRIEPIGEPPPSDFTRTTVYRYDFHLAKNDMAHFPAVAWKRAIHAVLRQDYDGLLFYGDRQGEWGLRSELAKYLYRYRGVRCRPEQLVIGAEQYALLHVLTLMLGKDSGPVAAEDPCYPLIPEAFRAAGFAVVPMAVNEEGLDLKQLESSRAGIVVAAPSHQFPSGRIMAASERQQLAEWSKRTGGIIIEDDYGGELRYQGRPVPALQGLDERANVVYLGGLSQIFAPDLCIHYMVLPEALLPAYRRLGQTLMFEPSSSRMLQRALEIFLASGQFERHVRRMRHAYRRKKQLLAAALAETFGPSGMVRPAATGLHLVLEVASLATEDELVAAAKQAGIRIAAASPYYKVEWPAPPARQLIVGFGGVEEARLAEGALALAEALRPYLIDSPKSPIASSEEE